MAKGKCNNLIMRLFKFARFSTAGISCFFLDWGMLYFFTAVFHWHYLFSSGLSYTISTVINYILSVRFVFKVNEDNKRAYNFFWFVFFSAVSLVLTVYLMRVGVEYCKTDYRIVKVVVALVVMVFNYFTRKLSLETDYIAKFFNKILPKHK